MTSMRITNIVIFSYFSAPCVLSSMIRLVAFRLIYCSSVCDCMYTAGSGPWERKERGKLYCLGYMILHNCMILTTVPEELHSSLARGRNR